MLIIDDDGKIFDDRRKGERRQKNVKVKDGEEKRKNAGRRKTDKKDNK